jgi:outer membrane scaffolding protein for murein synthesis (MipA/OmpV family)
MAAKRLALRSRLSHCRKRADARQHHFGTVFAGFRNGGGTQWACRSFCFKPKQGETPVAVTRLSGAAAFALLCLAAAPAAAQQSGDDQTYMDRPNNLTVGVGAVYLPSYEGSNDYEVEPAAAAIGKVDGFSFVTRGTSLSVNLIREGQKAPISFAVGPVAHLRLDRSSRIEDPVVASLGKIKKAVELGGYAGISFNHVLDPYDSLTFRAQVQHDVTSVHRSTLWSPAVEYLTPVTTRTIVSLSVEAEHAGNGFASTYFSVTPVQSLRSGLPVYNARGGWKDWRASLLVGQVLTGDLRRPRLSAFAGLSYSRELGDFARAPIVAIRGSPNQWLVAGGLAYSF